MEAADMTDKPAAFEVDVVNNEVDSTSNIMTNSSGNICNSQLLEASIEDAKNKKIILVSKMNSVKNLMKQVEYEEKAAEEAKVEAGLNCSDIFANVDGSKQALLLAQETTNKLAQKVKREKYILTNKIEAFQLRVEQMLDDGDRALAVLEEMHKTLEMRLASALMQKEIANKKKQVRDVFISLSLVDQEVEMEKAVEELKRLEQEELEICKLQELLIDRANVVDILHGEISDKCLEVLLLKEEFDQAMPDRILWSERKLPNDLTSSSFDVFDVVDKIKEDEHEAFVDLQSTIKSPENNMKNPLVIEEITKEKRAMLSEDLVDLQSTIKSTENTNEFFEAEKEIPLEVEEIREEKLAMLIEDSVVFQSTVKSAENENGGLETDIKTSLVVEEITKEEQAMLKEDLVILQSTIKSAENENGVLQTDKKKSRVDEEITEEEQAMLTEDWVVLQSSINGSENENDVSESDIQESIVVEDVKEEEQTMLMEAPVVVKDVTKKKQPMLTEGSGILQSIMKNKYFRENQKDVRTNEADAKAPLVVKDEKQVMLREGSAISHTTMKNKHFRENPSDVVNKKVNKPTEDQMPAKNVKSAATNQRNDDGTDALVFCIILFLMIVLWFFNGFPR